ncbi:MAG: Nif3-like dinuclear metal center hexameric protein [Bacillota bacterium]
MTTVREIVAWMEQWAPAELAEEWDNVGLQLGSAESPVGRVVVALDAGAGVVEFCRHQQVGLLITHHPLIFQPLRQVRTDRPQGRLVSALLEQGIALYVSHTNFDLAAGGLNDLLAQALGLADRAVLLPAAGESLYKLVVFVPTSHTAAVRQALGDAGAGWIGQYSHCTFAARGTGTFLPRSGANPYLGEPGRLEEVEEERLETIVPERRRVAVLEAMRAAHPYEEIAYDLIPLANRDSRAGLGRVGAVEPQPLASFVQRVELALGARPCCIDGDPGRTIRRVAVCAGSGGHLVERAAGLGADVLITGDIGYHQRQEASALGMALIDAGHAETEALFVPAIADQLCRDFPGLHVLTYPERSV